MKRMFVRFCLWYSGKSCDQLKEAFLFYHFITRSRWRSYWLAVTA